ncbi:MAG: KGK domain-containing protein [Nostocaceae cyanobacterium]|nr:KGK domain-containing protein [Nostocaceae cyanobacterium]
MEYNSHLENCSDDDVLAFSSNHMFKIGLLKTAVSYAFTDKYQVSSILSSALSEKGVHIHETIKVFAEGKDCEILKIGAKGWQKGKLRIRVSVDFIPDEPETSQPESPLDDLRQKLNETTS